MFSSQQQPMVLIVDDDPSCVEILAMALKPAYQTKIARNGLDALENVTTSPLPDLILLDIMMPEMDGLTVCRRLKSHAHTKKIPIIFTTTMDAESDEALGLTLGAADYIIKLISIPIAMARIHNQICLKQQAELLEYFSMLDPVTHHPNRYYFEERLESEWHCAARDETPLSLVMIKIDYFEQYKNHYGFGAEDVCLKAVIEALSNNAVRARDQVAYYGGAEFAVILPNTHQEAALITAERLCNHIKTLHLQHRCSPIANIVTASAGVATQTKISKKAIPQMLVDEAEQALFMAMEMGGMRVISAP